MSAQVECFEAICSALYQLPWSDFLGEKDLPYDAPEKQMARHAWFHIGDKPKDLRVTVIRPDKTDAVDVRIEWRNYFADGRNPLKGEQTIRISTYAVTVDALKPATESAVIRVLEVYRDVLGETGVAGRLEDLADSHGVNSDEE